jgi:hypothetical protein
VDFAFFNPDLVIVSGWEKERILRLELRQVCGFGLKKALSNRSTSTCIGICSTAFSTLVFLSQDTKRTQNSNGNQKYCFIDGVLALMEAASFSGFL